jgi:hypothetical protein
MADVTGSKGYDAAPTAAKCSHECKLYPTGSHGYGLHCERVARAWADGCVREAPPCQSPRRGGEFRDTPRWVTNT